MYFDHVILFDLDKQRVARYCCIPTLHAQGMVFITTNIFAASETSLPTGIMLNRI